MSSFEQTINLELNAKEASLVYGFLTYGAELYENLKPDAKERALDILNRLILAYEGFNL